MPKTRTVSNSHPRWPQLAEAIQTSRVAMSLDYIHRAAFARAVPIDVKTLQLIDGDRPGVVGETTLDKVTAFLGWQTNEWRRILDEGAVPELDPIRSAPDAVLLRELLRRAEHRDDRAVNA